MDCQGKDGKKDMLSGTSTDKKVWRFIRDMNGSDENRLNATALICGRRGYSYRQFFRRCDRYAEVFSALNITEKKHARAGLTGIPGPEVIFAFYALNMTGTSVSMVHAVDLNDSENFRKMVRAERITDLVLANNMVTPDLIKRILADRYKLGIRHIIILPISRAFSYPGEDENPGRSLKRDLKKFRGVYFMDDLLEEHEAFPICYGSPASDSATVILHTSGTTKGIHKPVPLSDRGLNHGAAAFLAEESFAPLAGKLVTYLNLDLSSVYALADILHLTLAFGGKLVLLPRVGKVDRLAKVIQDYGVNVLFASGALMESFIHLGNQMKTSLPDLSSLQFIFLGGSYVSMEAKKRYDTFLARCGCTTAATIGYGLSEAGGACILSSPDRKDDAMGYPITGVKIRVRDEETGIYHGVWDGPLRGVLHIASPGVSCGQIDGEHFFDLVEIEGSLYLNTYDLVDILEDGSLAYAGRMDRYFVNNEGIRFEAGLVEKAVSAQPGILACGLAPGYDKSMHDTIPVLYVQTGEEVSDRLACIKEALCQVFIRDGLVKETNLPGQCIIMNRIPFTETGKVDTRKILMSDEGGTIYRILPIRKEGRLMDVRLLPFIDSPGQRAGIPVELEEEFKKRIIKKTNDYSWRGKKPSFDFSEEEIRIMRDLYRYLAAMGCDQAPDEKELAAMGCE